MKRNIVIALMCVLMACMMFSCGDHKYPGYKKTSDGLYYRFYERGKGHEKAKVTDYLKTRLTYYLNDSLIYSSAEFGDTARIQVVESKFKGDLFSGLTMLREGDSVSFIVPADSTFVTMFGQSRDSLTVSHDAIMRFEMKVLEIQDEKSFKAEVEAANKALMQRSKDELAAYIKNNNIQVTPTESGIYILPLQPGKGRCPVNGEEVVVDYSLSLLNGEKITSSAEDGQSFTFILGNGYVIPGWEEVVPKMHLGETVRTIIPFDMAYGEHVVGPIQAYSNLIYEIKLLKITTAAELAERAKKEAMEKKAQSDEALRKYLKDNNITVAPMPSGLYYIKNSAGDGQLPTAGSVARITFVAKYLDGTLLGKSDDLGDAYFDVPLGEGRVLKGLEEGITHMSKGEEATFILPYSLAYGEHDYQNIPAYSNLVFKVKLLDIVSKEKDKVEKEAQAKTDFDKYLKDNKINKSHKTKSGLVYVKTKDGYGAMPTSGATVTVNYVGKFLDGKVFDSSEEHGGPVSFVIGEDRVIKGWEEGIMLMHKGEKGSLVVPFNLAYGEKQTGAIPAYSNLQFDIELVDFR